jgi:hypothetical protein
MDEELSRLIQTARRKQMTAEDREEQRVSFAHGNCAENDEGTIESVRLASEHMRAQTTAPVTHPTTVRAAE